MAFDISTTRFLLYARSLGVDFTRTAMIGRQNFWGVGQADLRRSLAIFGLSSAKDCVQSILPKNKGGIYPQRVYVEEFLRQCLSASEVHSFDYSNYQGATHIHDMNRGIPKELKEQYSVVIDGGSLEHVFNFPVAIKNCMEMVQVGGHYIGMTPANNWMGHGFYQLSPELYFSTFTEENGYKLVNVIAYESQTSDTRSFPVKNPKWFSVKNPKAINQRATLINRKPVLLLILAERVHRSKIFENMPQQSDYIATWTHPTTTFTPKRRSLLTYIKQRLPIPLKQLLITIARPFKRTFDPKVFEPFKLPNNIQSSKKASGAR